MPYAAVNDINMYYEEMGEGEPIILMHGAMASLLDKEPSWVDLMPFLAQKYRAIHIEHRGHGRTNNPAGFYNYVMIADDVCKFIEFLGLKNVHLAGVSDGAIAAIHIGMTRPEIPLSIICVGVNYYNDELVKEANKLLDIENFAKTPREEKKFSLMHDHNKGEGYWRELLRQTSENLAVNPNYSLEDLTKITAPTLLLAGENDLWANPNQMVAMRKAIKNSELMIVNHAGHEVQYTHPQIIGPVIMDFMHRHTKTKLE